MLWPTDSILAGNFELAFLQRGRVDLRGDIMMVPKNQTPFLLHRAKDVFPLVDYQIFSTHILIYIHYPACDLTQGLVEVEAS